jgi:hypothetical protein
MNSTLSKVIHSKWINRDTDGNLCGGKYDPINDGSKNGNVNEVERNVIGEVLWSTQYEKYDL